MDVQGDGETASLSQGHKAEQGWVQEPEATYAGGPMV